MNNNTRSIIAVIALLAIIVFLGWFFWDIVLYIFTAIFLSLIGTPVVRLLTRIRIGKWNFPTSLAAAITLILIIAILVVAGYFILPAITREISYLSTLESSNISSSFETWINNLDPMLRKFGLLKPHDHAFDMIMIEASKLLQDFNLSSILSNTFSLVGSLFIAVFSILFMTFFALKDHNIFFKMVKGWLPVKYRKNFDNILDATGKQLSSYFLGVLMEMLIVGIIEIVMCLILGVPNALLIGAIGGLLNIIPYVGPLIAGIVGIVISVTSLITSELASAVLFSTALKVVIAFVVAKLVDDFVLQPYIYGKRTHTHPLEIFIVILMAGYLGGVFAMVFAVPAYTLLRIVVKEFFGAYYQENVDEPTDTDDTTPPVVTEVAIDESIVKED